MKTLLIGILLSTLPLTLRGGQATPVPAEPQHFTIEELEGMADRGEWNDIVLHLEDVLPTQRDARWEAVVERGSLGYLATLAGQGTAAERMSDALLKRFPTLARSEKYHRARLDTRLRGLEACYQHSADDPGCAERYRQFADENRHEADWLRRAAEIVSRRKSAAAAMPYYQGWIETDRRGATVCDEPAVRRALLSALGGNREARRQASDLCAGICWQTMRGELSKALRQSPSPTAREAICAVLRGKQLPDDACRRKR